jgi:hypothetical protein
MIVKSIIKIVFCELNLPLISKILLDHIQLEVLNKALRYFKSITLNGQRIEVILKPLTLNPVKFFRDVNG